MRSREEEQRLLVQTLCGEYRVRGRSGEAEAAAEVLAQPAVCRDSSAAREQLRLSVEQLSGDRNTVCYDEAGYPSVMVRVPMVRCRDVLASSEDAAPHPAFRSGKKTVREILVSKYLNCVVDGRACSLPLAQPFAANSFDDAAGLCYRKGHGWMAMPFPLRMAIALSCRREGFLPGGNNDSGADYFHPEERGTPVGATGLVLTGSGPRTWSHDRSENGLWDLNGNLSEWDGGFRLMDGELQFVELPQLLDASSVKSDSSAWHAVDAQGRPVPPGSPDALHYDVKGGKIRLVVRKECEGIGNCSFGEISAGEAAEAPEFLRLCGLCPDRNWSVVENEGWRWVSTQGEFMPICGGAYRAVDHAGVFFTGMTKARSSRYSMAGVRCVYVAPEAIQEVVS